MYNPYMCMYFILGYTRFISMYSSDLILRNVSTFTLNSRPGRLYFIPPKILSRRRFTLSPIPPAISLPLFFLIFFSSFYPYDKIVRSSAEPQTSRVDRRPGHFTDVDRAARLPRLVGRHRSSRLAAHRSTLRHWPEPG